jgi:hypothetical protein
VRRGNVAGELAPLAPGLVNEPLDGSHTEIRDLKDGDWNGQSLKTSQKLRQKIGSEYFNRVALLLARAFAMGALVVATSSAIWQLTV